MSEERKIEVAKQYVDKQLETMRKHGSAPKELSEQELEPSSCKSRQPCDVKQATEIGDAPVIAPAIDLSYTYFGVFWRPPKTCK